MIEKGTVVDEPDGPTPHSQFEHSSIPTNVKKLLNLKYSLFQKSDAKGNDFSPTKVAIRYSATDTEEEAKISIRPFIYL
ncbi:unnamed protein product [Arabis nemorensis]|uniref:Uncharacterized protein n=1 Tax=Arabis nemorensis TaxID=586526 RepID=A0A565AN20_9BRAS|nr:unnamed protein product [Arabis nemorensis]